MKSEQHLARLRAQPVLDSPEVLHAGGVLRISAGAVAVLIIFLIFFRDPPKTADSPTIAGRREEDFETP